jgi:hypothetical protein
MKLIELNDRLKDHHLARKKLIGEVFDFFQGDFYRGGAGFDGPPPLPKVKSSQAVYDTVLELIPTYFTSKDLVKKACQRHTDGVLGQEPKWYWVTGERIDENGEVVDNRSSQSKKLDKLYTEWWDKTNLKKTLQDATMTALWAYDATSTSMGMFDASGIGVERISTNERDSREIYSTKYIGTRTLKTPDRTSAILRLYYPQRYRRKKPSLLNPLKTASFIEGKFEEILRNLRVQLLSPHTSGIVKDDDNEPLYGYYTYALSKWEGNGSQSETELSILVRDAPDEILKLLPSTPATDTEWEDLTIHCLIREDVPYQASLIDLKGKLLFHELTREPLITASSLNLQRKINLIGTIMSINAGDGIGMKALFNVLPPAKYVRKGENGKETQITLSEYLSEPNREIVEMQPVTVPVGNGMMGFFQGSPNYGADGSYTGPSNPSFQKIGANDTAPLREDRDTFIRDFYEEVDQVHILASSDGAVGEESRKQMFAVFEASLGKTSTTIESAMRWTLEASRDFAAYYSKDTSYQDLSPYAQTNVVTYMITPEDKRVSMEAAEKGYIANDTARAELGVSDVDAEKAVIRNQEDDPIEVKKQEQLEREDATLDKTLKAKQKVVPKK